MIANSAMQAHLTSDMHHPYSWLDWAYMGPDPYETLSMARGKQARKPAGKGDDEAQGKSEAPSAIQWTVGLLARDWERDDVIRTRGRTFWDYQMGIS